MCVYKQEKYRSGVSRQQSRIPARKQHPAESCSTRRTEADHCQQAGDLQKGSAEVTLVQQCPCCEDQVCQGVAHHVSRAAQKEFLTSTDQNNGGTSHGFSVLVMFAVYLGLTRIQCYSFTHSAQTITLTIFELSKINHHLTNPPRF